MAAEAGFIEVIIGVGILLAAAIIVGELFSRIKLPVVLGQLIAGMIIGPFALGAFFLHPDTCLLYTSPSPRDGLLSRMPSSA